MNVEIRKSPNAGERWWFLDHDPETEAWSECLESDPIKHRQDDADKHGEDVVYYDGWVYCATVIARTFEEAVERAKVLEDRQYALI